MNNATGVQTNTDTTARLEFALRAARMYIWERDLASTNVVRFGDPFEILGMTGGSIDDFVDYVHPDDRQRVQHSIDQVFATCEPYELEFRLIRADGQHIWVRDVGKRMMTPGGERFVGACIDITSEVKARDAIAHLALHDGLTNLPNRMHLRRKIDNLTSRPQGSTCSIAVLAMDLSGFKQINDTFGHKAGDLALVAFANLLLTTFNDAHVIGRMGGDEFIVVLETTTVVDVGLLANNLILALKSPLNLEGQEVSLGVSVGAAIGPRDGWDTESLLHCADLALYEAKESTADDFCMYRTSMNLKAQRRRTLESELRVALERGQLRMAYQPLISVESGLTESVEALMRWEHPELGTIEPDEFIPIAEATGLIVPLGTWALQTACHAARDWPEHRIAINVSVAQFRHRDFISTVICALASSQIDPTRVELEITESVLLENTESTREVFSQLRSIGVSISIDDFGIGYSSLGTLAAFAFDRIKIDKSFISQLGTSNEATAVVQAVLNMSKSLGVMTTAEGVETVGQMQFLSTHGCSQLQGFLFSRAVSANAISVLLDRECLTSPQRWARRE